MGQNFAGSDNPMTLRRIVNDLESKNANLELQLQRTAEADATEIASLTSRLAAAEERAERMKARNEPLLAVLLTEFGYPDDGGTCVPEFAARMLHESRANGAAALASLRAAEAERDRLREGFDESQAIIKDRDIEIEEAWKEANAASGPIKLAIYTTDDGRITSVVERDEDGDPCDRGIDSTAIVAHVERIVERYEGLNKQWVKACEIAQKHCEKFTPVGRSFFDYIPSALAAARADAVKAEGDRDEAQQRLELYMKLAGPWDKEVHELKEEVRRLRESNTGSTFVDVPEHSMFGRCEILLKKVLIDEPFLSEEGVTLLEAVGIEGCLHELIRRYEKAIAALAAARDEAVREFAEVCRTEFDTETQKEIAEAAASYLARKEPTDV